MVGGDFTASDHALVQQTWAGRWGALQPQWDQALLKGLAAAAPPAIAAPPVHVPERLPAIHPEPLELLVRPDPTGWDGRFGNNTWAQEKIGQTSVRARVGKYVELL